MLLRLIPPRSVVLARLAKPLKAVIPEDIALRLDDIGAAVALSHAVIPSQTCRKRRHRMPAVHRAAHHLPQGREGARKGLGELWRKDQLAMRWICGKGACDIIQQS